MSVIKFISSKKVILAALSITVLFTAVGCTKNLPESSESTKSAVVGQDTTSVKHNEKEGDEVSNIEASKYNTELASYFPNTEKSEFLFSGGMDYAHKSVIEKVEDEKETLTISVKGEVEDLSGGAAGSAEDFTFRMKYIVTKDKVLENYDKLSKYPEKPVPSNGVILQFPLKEGDSWDTTFIYKDKNYTGRTKITKIEALNGNSKITTIATIDGIEDFKGRVYKETREYESSRGIVATEFSTTTEAYDFWYKLNN